MDVTLGILRCAQNDGKTYSKNSGRVSGNSNSKGVVAGLTVFLPPIAKVRDGWGA
jgi:hypothetical protein